MLIEKHDHDGPRSLRVCVLSTLYPNAAMPHVGLFVERRLQHILRIPGVTAEVIAPVPWFPSKHSMFGRYAVNARIPAFEEHSGIRIRHPRYVVIPKIGSAIAPLLLAAGVLHAMRALQHSGFDFDVIDAHFFYPDGVAAALVARALCKPLLITARGSDINLYAKFPLQRRMIRWAAAQARFCVTVSDALRSRLLECDVDPGKVKVLRNGVDVEFFRPLEVSASRARLGVCGNVALSVGNLVELKGHHLAVEAIAQLPGWTLLIAGAGPMEGQLRRRIEQLGLGSRVRLLGSLESAQLRDCYTASDVLVLASSREGMPNVVLEALACGLPVIATAVGGVPEVVTDSDLGLLLDERTPAAIARALRASETKAFDRSTIRRHAMHFDWGATARGHLALLRRAAEIPA